jgi:aldehyde:ferredoxin oxidoreductase
MGSKKLKAVVAKGRGRCPHQMLPRPKLLWKKAHQILIGKSEMRRYGTGYAGYSVG